MDRVDPTDVRLCLEANRNCGLSVDGVLRPSIAAAATGRSSLRRGVGWPPSPRSQRVLPRLTDRRLFLYRTIATGGVSRVDSTSRARLVWTANRRYRKLRLGYRSESNLASRWVRFQFPGTDFPPVVYKIPDIKLSLTGKLYGSLVIIIFTMLVAT